MTVPVGTLDVLVTGSRNWVDYETLSAALWTQYQDSLSRGLRLRVIHGNNPRGADAMADYWAREMAQYGVLVEPVDADWNRDCDKECTHRPRVRADGSRYCPVAGNYRNQKMVDMGPEICLAFLTPEARGTRDCASRAERAGIEVKPHTERAS